MFKLCSLPDICQQSVQTPYPGFLVLVFVFVKWLCEDRAVYEVYMIPNSNQQVCQHFVILLCKVRLLLFIDMARPTMHTLKKMWLLDICGVCAKSL